MADNRLIKIKPARGSQSDLLALTPVDLAELLYATDFEQLFIGNGISNGKRLISGLIVDTLVNIPSPGVARRLFFASDYNELYIDNGVAWVKYNALTNAEIVGLGYDYLTTTSVRVFTGRCKDSTNAIDIIADIQIDINLTTTGAGGLDTGTIAADTVYYLYAIYGSSGYSAVASTNQSNPTLPGGYTYYRRIGFFRTEVGSTDVVRFTMDAHGQFRTFWYTNPIVADNALISGGTDTTPTALPTNTLAPLSVGAIVNLALDSGSNAAATLRLYVNNGQTSIFARYRNSAAGIGFFGMNQIPIVNDAIVYDLSTATGTPSASIHLTGAVFKV